MNRQERVAVLFLCGALLAGTVAAWVDARDPARLADFHVVRRSVVPPPALPPPTASAVSVNRAAAADLEGLPGIGPKTAAAIVAYREAHGPFRAVDDLAAVRGIGPATVARLRDLLTTD